MAVYRDEAVVLRKHLINDSDRIITLLTRHNGKVRAVAKGVRKPKSKFGSSVEPFTHVDLQMYTGRNLDTITQTQIIEPFGLRIAADYSRYTTGTAMLETADRLVVEEREPATQQYRLLLGAVRALAEGQYPADLVLDAYLLRALAVDGFAPSFDDCARCGTPGPHTWFSPPTGGMVCSRCRPAGSVSPAAGTVTLLAALLSGDWDQALVSAAAERAEAHGIVAAFVPWHLERGLRSLRHVQRA